MTSCVFGWSLGNFWEMDPEKELKRQQIQLRSHWSIWDKLKNEFPLQIELYIPENLYPLMACQEDQSSYLIDGWHFYQGTKDSPPAPKQICIQFLARAVTTWTSIYTEMNMHRYVWKWTETAIVWNAHLISKHPCKDLGKRKPFWIVRNANFVTVNLLLNRLVCKKYTIPVHFI